MATAQDVNATPKTRSTEELRAEMCRLIDEIATARSERFAALKAEFERLWNDAEVAGKKPTVH